jgi:hypothetical protein
MTTSDGPDASTGISAAILFQTQTCGGFCSRVYSLMANSIISPAPDLPHGAKEQRK